MELSKLSRGWLHSVPFVLSVRGNLSNGHSSCLSDFLFFWMMAKRSGWRQPGKPEYRENGIRWVGGWRIGQLHMGLLEDTCISGFEGDYVNSQWFSRVKTKRRTRWISRLCNLQFDKEEINIPAKWVVILSNLHVCKVLDEEQFCCPLLGQYSTVAR